MPTDHPDGTRPIVISRADIQTPIDFQHQTRNMDTDFKAQSVGAHSEAEWEVKAGKSKGLYKVHANIAVDGQGYVSYIVTHGTTLYVVEIGFGIKGYAAADRDKEQVGYIELIDMTDDEAYATLGGNGGGGIYFASPILFVEDHEVGLYYLNHTNHAVTFRVFFGGYEI